MDALPIVQVDIAEVKAAFDRIKKGGALPKDFDLVEGLIGSYVGVTQLLRERGATIARLRRLFGFTNNEKTANVVGKNGSASPSCGEGPEPACCSAADKPGTSLTGGAAPESGSSATGATPTPDVPPGPGSAGGPSVPEPAANQDPSKKKPKGHGRFSWEDYPGAQCFPVLHESLGSGETCPRCGQGKLYDTKRPAPFLVIVGQPPFAPMCWLCQVLRCSFCGHLYTARPPKEARGPKYDETAVAMMGLFHYGAGLPFHRLARLQQHLKAPVPASTQWDVVKQATDGLRPVFTELRRQTAQARLLHTDDSYVRILEFMGKRRATLVTQGALPDPDRTGLYTTAMVAITEKERSIAVFSSGRRHAGENLADLLKAREPGHSAPILMCDGLDRNVPKGHDVVESNCLSHGRRHVVDEVENYPRECTYLLTKIARIYRIDRLIRAFKLSAEQRLRVHQKWSGPVMDELHQWISTQLDEKRIEPNSDMGKALKYLRKRWDKLTLFLRRAGAAICNNVCERALKMAIQHRNASLFYKTQKGATVGDIYMTLIYTAQLNGVNPLDYLTELLRHTEAVAANPADWMPWNYRETLARMNPDPPRPGSPQPKGPDVPPDRAAPGRTLWPQPLRPARPPPN